MHIRLNHVDTVHFNLLIPAVTSELRANDGIGTAIPTGEHAARALLCDIIGGRSVPAEYGKSILEAQAPPRITADFHIEPPHSDTSYDVRYECTFGIETEQEALQAGGRARQPFLKDERLTYVELRAQKTGHRRKAFDTVGVGRYKGVHPKDVQQALTRAGGGSAYVSALRLLTERLGRSLFFFPDFLVLVRATAALRPGHFFLQTLRMFAAYEFHTDPAGELPCPAAVHPFPLKPYRRTIR